MGTPSEFCTKLITHPLPKIPHPIQMYLLNVTKNLTILKCEGIDLYEEDWTKTAYILLHQFATL